MVNASGKHIQNKLDTLKNTMINEVIEITGLIEVNSNWSKIPVKENKYNRTDGWFKTRSISTEYNRVAIFYGSFQSGGKYIVAIDEVSYRVIATGQEFSNLGHLSWVMLRGKKNVRTRIINAYFPTVSASAGGSYIQQ